MGCLILASSSSAYNLMGRIGVDLQTYSFATSLKDTLRAYSATRSRSGHFLDLTFGGPLVTPEFASFLSRVSLNGAYFRSETDVHNQSEYIDPGLRSYFGQLTLFPSRPYPLKLHRSSTENYDLRYEANNRGDKQRLQPELSVVRRYRSEHQETGAGLQVAPSDNFKLMLEFKQEFAEVGRIYDFGEDKDIWVNFNGFRGRPDDSVFSVVFLNATTDTLHITVYNLDSLEQNGDPKTIVIEDFAPGASAIDSLYLGRNHFSFQSPAFNALEGTFDVQEHLKVEIEYRDPVTPNDIDQERNAFTGRLKLGGGGALQNETYLERAEQTEEVQKQVITITNFSNNAKYKPSRNLDITMLTTYLNDKTIVDTLAPQLTEAFTHQSRASYSPRTGLSGSILHSYSTSSAIVDVDTLTSDMNMVNVRLSYPSSRWNHRVDVKGNVSFLSDNSGYANNLYASDITNTFAVRRYGTLLKPKHQFKVAKNIQENPNKISNEIESKSTLIAELPRFRLLGDMRMRGEHSYRKRSDEVGSDTKTRYILEGTLRRKFGNGYRLTVMAVNEWEKFGGSAPSGGTTEPKPMVHKASYKIDLQGEPIEDLIVQANVMLISQTGTSIKKFGLSLLGDLPLINIPIKSFLLYETRDLANLPRQTQTTIETKTNFRVRKITLILKHAYRHENQLFESYSVNEFAAEIARNFDVF